MLGVGSTALHEDTFCLPAAEFSIWTRDAGAGGLAIAVEGPSKAEISFEDRKDGSCGVAYVVQEPGTAVWLGPAGFPWGWGRFPEDQGCGSIWPSQRWEIKGIA